MPTTALADHAYARHVAQRRGPLDSLEPPPLSLDYDTTRWHGSWDGGVGIRGGRPYRHEQYEEIDEHGVPIPVGTDSPERHERAREAAEESGAPRWSAAWYAAWLAEATGREMLSARVTRCDDGGVLLAMTSSEAA